MFWAYTLHSTCYACTSKSTKTVLVYKCIPFFNTRFTLSLWGWNSLFAVTLITILHYPPPQTYPTPPPKKGFPKTAYLMALKSCLLRVFLCVLSHEGLRHKMHSYHLIFIFSPLKNSKMVPNFKWHSRVLYSFPWLEQQCQS
jgi:hypothetical protein